MKAPANPCQITEGIRPHPKGKYIAAVHKNCASGPEGLYIYRGSAFKNPEYIDLDKFFPISVSLDSNQMRWYGDELIFIATTDWKTPSGSQFRAKGIFGYSTLTKKLRTIFPPLSPESTYLTIAVHSKTRKILVGLQKTKDPNARYIYLGDLSNLSAGLSQLSAYKSFGPDCGE